MLSPVVVGGTLPHRTSSAQKFTRVDAFRARGAPYWSPLNLRGEGDMRFHREGELAGRAILGDLRSRAPSSKDNGRQPPILTERPAQLLARAAVLPLAKQNQPAMSPGMRKGASPSPVTGIAVTGVRSGPPGVDRQTVESISFVEQYRRAASRHVTDPLDLPVLWPDGTSHSADKGGVQAPTVPLALSFVGAREAEPPVEGQELRPALMATAAPSDTPLQPLVRSYITYRGYSSRQSAALANVRSMEGGKMGTGADGGGAGSDGGLRGANLPAPRGRAPPLKARMRAAHDSGSHAGDSGSWEPAEGQAGGELAGLSGEAGAAEAGRSALPASMQPLWHLEPMPVGGASMLENDAELCSSLWGAQSSVHGEHAPDGGGGWGCGGSSTAAPTSKGGEACGLLEGTLTTTQATLMNKQRMPAGPNLRMPGPPNPTPPTSVLLPSGRKAEERPAGRLAHVDPMLEGHAVGPTGSRGDGIINPAEEAWWLWAGRERQAPWAATARRGNRPRSGPPSRLPSRPPTRGASVDPQTRPGTSS